MSATIEIGDSVYPRPIHSETEHARLMEMLLRLDEREDLSPESTAARLAQPIAERAYGRARVEAQGHLACPGEQGAATEVLSGRRSISKTQAKRLSEFAYRSSSLFE